MPDVSQHSITGACLHAELIGDILNEEVFKICYTNFFDHIDLYDYAFYS